MTTDVNSPEIEAVVSVGQKPNGQDMAGKIRRCKFSSTVLADGETAQISNLLPPGAEIIEFVAFLGTGTGTVDVGLSNGGADDIAADVDPATTGTSTLVDNVSAGSNEVYLTATGAITLSGYIVFTASA